MKQSLQGDNIMRKDQITYATFIQAANEIRAEGQTPSVRLIRAKIGGSNSTLLGYLQQWRNDADLAASVDDNISETLRQAILSEYGRVTKSMRDHLETQLSQERAQNKEAGLLLNEAENRISELESLSENEKEQHATITLGLEKQLSATEEKAAELGRQVEKLEAQWKESIIAQESARTECAKAQLQLERADKSSAQAEKKIVELEQKIEKLQEAAHQAELRAAVAEAREGKITKSK